MQFFFKVFFAMDDGGPLLFTSDEVLSALVTHDEHDHTTVPPSSAHRERRDWSDDEDARLSLLVEAHGCKWRLIASTLGDRSDDAVRNRYKRMHDNVAGKPNKTPCVRTIPCDTARVAWTKEEDDRILQMNDAFGPGPFHKTLAEIAAHFDNRTPHAVRNRRQRILAMRSRRRSPSPVRT